MELINWEPIVSIVKMGKIISIDDDLITIESEQINTKLKGHNYAKYMKSI